MPNQKIENLLNLALEATPEERRKSYILNIGHNVERDTWEVIVNYQGDISFLEQEGIVITLLLGNYAILIVPADLVDTVALLPQITYMEKPKRLAFAAYQGRAVSCINPLQQNDVNGLFGNGVLVACIDSGIDYTHPDFRNEDGTTRILRLWDQTIQTGPAPEGYNIGTEYTKEQIDEALSGDPTLVPSSDPGGHGTAVMGIAAGNGRASEGVYAGVATLSSLVVVKLGTPAPNDFPSTTQLIQGIDYCVRLSLSLQMPIAINLSFGNNYGSHSGDSLIENYINTVANLGQNVICIGSGNEGNTALHTAGILLPNSSTLVEFSVGGYEPGLSIQLWKYYVDEFDIYLIHPNGTIVGPVNPVSGTQRYSLPGTDLLVYYGMPSPYSFSQEIFFDFLPGTNQNYLPSGIWTFRLVARRIVEGSYNLWLPSGGYVGTSTRFLTPFSDSTLTIPSTALRAITVGAYDSRLLTYADFSGRGYTRIVLTVKPDIVAPGVRITAPSSYGGTSYREFTGTSFATPFVTGSAALMMEWGIIRGNDAFLYGEKVKAYLRRGARSLPGFDIYPNPQVGYGALCLRDSIPL